MKQIDQYLEDMLAQGASDIHLSTNHQPCFRIDGEMQFQPEKKYVKCADCGMILPIRTITQEEKIVPLIEPEDE